MTEKILYTDFTGIDEIVSELLERKDFKRAMTRTNLCKFWGTIAGKKFADKSKPWGMLSGNVMVIACENNIVAQELLLAKSHLLQKFQPYLKSLKITVTDLKFDAKKWQK